MLELVTHHHAAIVWATVLLMCVVSSLHMWALPHVIVNAAAYDHTRIAQLLKTRSNRIIALLVVSLVLLFTMTAHLVVIIASGVDPSHTGLLVMTGFQAVVMLAITVNIAIDSRNVHIELVSNPNPHFARNRTP